MVWGMNMPSSFGEFWPNGDFEGDPLDWDSDGWGPRLKAYYAEQPPEVQKALFDYQNQQRGAAHSYPYYVSQKFINEIGAMIGPDRPPLSPIKDHEPPRYFQIIRGCKSLGSLIELNDRILAVDEALKRIIERLEPGVHQFFPIEIRLRNGKPYPTSYYTLVIGQYIDSFSPENSSVDAFRRSGESYFLNENSKAGITGLALCKAVFGHAHLWRERNMLSRPLFFSDEMQAEIANAGLRIPRHYRVREI
jgi:hypothetical protein